MGLGLAKCLKTGNKTSGTAFLGYLGPAPNQNALTYKKVLCFIYNLIHVMNFVFFAVVLDQLQFESNIETAYLKRLDRQYLSSRNTLGGK